VENESEMALFQARTGVAFGLPPAGIPEHHRAAAIFALGDGSLEAAIRERMIFRANGQSLIGRIEAWTFGDGPA
jgi:hypothetical protein